MIHTAAAAHSVDTGFQPVLANIVGHIQLAGNRAEQVVGSPGSEKG